MKTSALFIRTPEGVVFSQLLAGPVSRFLAWFVDFWCVLLLLQAVILLTSLIGLIDWSPQLIATTFTLLGIAYGITLEWLRRGQTVGKRMMRLRVVDAEGLRLQFSQVAVRNLLRLVDSLPMFYVVGGVACWLSPKCQRLGDLAANTIVIRNPRVTEPDLDQLLAGKYNSLRQYPHLVARLRQRVSPMEAAVVLQALVRRDEFDAPARVELFAELAAHFRTKAEFPADALDGITDEQYIRNVADVIYRTRTETRIENVAA